MANDIVSIVGDSLMAAQSWFTQLVDKSGLGGFILGMFAIYLAVRFLIQPLFGGSAGSDRAVKHRDSEEG